MQKLPLISLILAALLLFSVTLYVFSSRTLRPERAQTPVRVGAEYNGLYGVAVKGVLTPEMVELPAGSFTMGGARADAPPRRVELSRFSISRFEITNAQYLTFCQQTGRTFLADPHWDEKYPLSYPDHPVVQVSWQDAVDFCKWLSEWTGREVRLPTEAEWEYAAQGSQAGVTLETSKQQQIPTREVGASPPNRFGLHDLLGNAYEWCADWYDGSYYLSADSKDPKGPAEGRFKVIRGGSWADETVNCRVEYRAHAQPSPASPTVGFRVVMK